MILAFARILTVVKSLDKKGCWLV